MSATQLTLDTRSLEPQKADELMEAAIVWIRENPEAWDYLVASARDDAQRFGRVRVKSSMELLRFASIRGVHGPVKLPNAYSAAFTRILADWCPELAPFIPKATSKLDGCVIPPRQR